MNIPDVQNQEPLVHVKLNRVGITNLSLPIFVQKQLACTQHTVANIDCFVDLPKDKRGINMSRIPEAIHEHILTPLNYNVLDSMALSIMEANEADICQIIFRFPYFLEKEAPISEKKGLVSYDIEFDLTKRKVEMGTDVMILTSDFKLGVGVLATTCCPCSQAISEGGAHNQKCRINIKVLCAPDAWVWIEDLIEVAEKSASCEIYSILKRPDEAFVTNKMNENPRFVEDVTREAYQRLMKIKGIQRYWIEVISDESIHIHKAFARVEGSFQDRRTFGT
jgi:GTP cyclohydrolase I